MKKWILAIFLMAPLMTEARSGRNYSGEQRKQEKLIQQAYRKGKVTETEYRKLMEEQDIIKRAIELAQRDGFWTPDEKKRVAGKLNRAEKRLRRYKTNWETD
ncbi:MAG: hypothetical protein HWD58_00810 [Bacteroidota bacterium]|nr:MAG: hypothetical protein HWD58_00810 [Bacteroidota bacterium]